MEQVKKLREMTGAGIMDCKKALEENGGDFPKAVEFLKKKGIASAAKREDRQAKDGLIAISATGKKASMIELNCETDFVARTDDFKNLADSLAKKVLEQGEATVEKPETVSMVLELSGKVGEKMTLRRGVSVESPKGFVASYLHSNKKIGVLVAVSANQVNDEVQQFAKDIAMQIAASAPLFVSAQDIPAEILEREKAQHREQVAGKPAQIQDKIIQGKLDKWFETVCLVDQNFIKNEEQKIKQYIDEVSKKTGQPVSVSRFIRFELGR